MTRRPAVTLVEVLVSMFIMAIGMLALLTLFPLGAINMGKALRDDRIAATAAMAEQVAIARNLRHDGNVLSGITTADIGLPTTYTGPSNPVYVDPYGWIQRATAGLKVGSSNILRKPASFASTAVTADRWFSLPDDLTFLDNGAPDKSSNFVQRGHRYTYALMLRRPQAVSDQMLEMSVVVYVGRPTDVLTLEPTYPPVPNPNNYTVTGALGTNNVTLRWTAGTAPSIKRGTWILDTTLDPASGNKVVQAHFYRVVNAPETIGNSLVLEVTPNLKAAVNSITIMEYVAEVFDKGTSWEP